MESLGASISVTSYIEKGTTFKVKCEYKTVGLYIKKGCVVTTYPFFNKSKTYLIPKTNY